jgi:adenosylmethionine-8-amino-7-oxononanoate aminotransferase
MSRQQKAIFMTGTDTNVGKTTAALVIGLLLQKRNIHVGVMKPFQCAGEDAAFLKKKLSLRDALKDINPYFAKEPLSPHLAFSRQKTKISLSRIRTCFEKLKARYDVVLVEGAGGLLAPIQDNYLMADLARELDLEVLIVSRLSLGTINHTLLTINQARTLGLKVCGVVFNQGQNSSQGLAEKTNPLAIRKFGRVNILGTIPYLKSFDQDKIVAQCAKGLDLEKILKRPAIAQTEKLVKDDHQYIWHPFTQMKDWLHQDPLVIDEAKGCWLKDTNGRWYLDGVSSLWVNVHGHRHKSIDQAICAQLAKVSHSTLLGLTNIPAIDLARRLVSLAPRGLKKVFYSDSGSTAVEIAIKMAYQYWQNRGKMNKKMIIHFAHSYHGDTLGSVSVGGIDLFHRVYHDLIFKAMKWPTPYPSAFGEEEKFKEKFFKAIEKLEVFLKHHHGNVAALIVEPMVQGAAGMVVWPQGALKKIAHICRRYDVLFIADEVATGFGRTGKMFACEHEGVSPDILCLAKGLSAGYLPLAATLTTQRIFDGFLFDYKEQKTFFHGHTYTGNPLACAAAIANLNVFYQEKTLKKLAPKIQFLKIQFKKFKTLVHVGNVRQKGFMVGIELVKDKKKRDEYAWEEKMGIKVCQRARDHGVILRPLGNVIVLMPPLSMTRKELQILLTATGKAIKEITEHV